MMHFRRRLFHVFVGSESFESGRECFSDGERRSRSVDAAAARQAGVGCHVRLQSGADAALLTAQQSGSPINVTALLKGLILRYERENKREREHEFIVNMCG